MINIKLNKEQLKALEGLKVGETYEVLYKGLDAYIERVEDESTANLFINNNYFAFNFFFPSVVVANPQTIQQFLNSRQFKKEYKCWNYDNRLYNQYNELIDGDKYELYDDEKYYQFITSHYVVRTSQEWELAEDGEMYAFCKIIIEE